MKKLSASARTLLILLLLAVIPVLCLLPQFLTRIYNEAANDSVVLSLLYSDMRDRGSDEALPVYLDRFAEAGVTAVSLPEDTIDTLASRGYVSEMRYHEIRSKYDASSSEIAEALSGIPGVEYNSHIFIVNKRDTAARLDEWLPLYYTSEECVKAGEFGGSSVYVFFDSNTSVYDIPVGYDEETLGLIREHGLDIALSMRVGAYSRTEYIDKTGGLIEKYGVSYFVLKKDGFSKDKDDNAQSNADGVASLIKDHSLTLVVTENADQLSNIRSIGYDDIFDAADGRVLRSFETYDCSNPDSTGYKFRSIEYLNSVTDRNIRFITVTQLALGGKSNTRLADDTILVVAAVRDRLTELGYDTETCDTMLDYSTGTYVFALSSSFMVLAGAAVLSAVFSLGGRRYTAVSVVLAAASFGVTYLMPRQLLLLYPTALALTVPCLAAALALLFVKKARGKAASAAFITGTVAILPAVTAVGGVVMAALTSGLDYYINNDIFRGIKLSLYVPLLFAVTAYYIMFIKRSGTLADDIKRALTARIRVWWCIVAVTLGAVSFIYILRSGNVDSISKLEEAMRNFITEHFSSRPRTKEFLIAYPCAVLFAWYCRRPCARVIPWILAAGAAIVPASVMNTFCHVFTDVSVQYGRLLNGLLFGAFTMSAALAVNCLIAAAYRRIKRGMR